MLLLGLTLLKMKKIHQTLWEKDPFKILVNFFTCMQLSPLFHPILLKRSQISCIINRHQPDWKWRKSIKHYGHKNHFKLVNLSSLTRLSPHFLSNSFETCTNCLYHQHLPYWKWRKSVKWFWKKRHLKFWTFLLYIHVDNPVIYNLGDVDSNPGGSKIRIFHFNY